MEEVIGSILAQILSSLVEKGIKYLIKKATDSLGNVITQIVLPVDSDGDGVTDYEDVLFSFDYLIPDSDSSYTLVNRDDEIGFGLPEFQPIDHNEIIEYLSDKFSGNSDGYLIDRDSDGLPEVYCPLPYDYTGDGVNDWGQLIDLDHNGIPDASPLAPFYPVGSDGYNQILNSDENEKSIIIVSPDGTLSVYDADGELQYEDFNEAYSLWLKDNAALDKPFSYYSVTEALLLIVALFAGVSLIGKLFKRRNYHGHY